MSENNLDFRVDAGAQRQNALLLNGAPLASGAPTDGQTLVFNTMTGQWGYGSAAMLAGFPIQTSTPPANGDTIRFNAATSEWVFGV